MTGVAATVVSSAGRWRCTACPALAIAVGAEDAIERATAHVTETGHLVAVEYAATKMLSRAE